MDDNQIDELDDDALERLLRSVAYPPPDPDLMGFGVHDMRLIRPKEMKKLLQVSNSTLYRLISSGRIPRPRCVSARVTGWPEHEVMTLLQQMPSTKANAA